MRPEYAAALSDAIARTRHPRLDYRTAEAQRYVARLRPVLRQLVAPGCRALDLGCGAGKFTFELERLGARAVGLDCSPEAIRLAREIAAAMGSAAHFVMGTFAALPFAPESLDLVIFPQNIVECSYEEMDSIARQLGVVLRPGGRFCLEMQDGLAQWPQGRAGIFDPATGKQRTAIEIPGQGEFPYEATFWTVGFARSVVTRYLHFASMDQEDDQRYILCFDQ